MSTKEQITYEQLLEKDACEEALAFFINMLNNTHYTKYNLPTDEQLKTLVTRTPEFEYSRSFIEFALQTEIRAWVGWFWSEDLLPHISLGGVNFRRANLEGAYLIGANLEGAYLIGANLIKANLIGVKLERANLYKANLERANLIEANLERANLREANLQGADLQEANLWGANLQGANLNNTNLEDILWNSKTIWPDGFTSHVSD